MAARKKKEIVEGEEKSNALGLFDHLRQIQTVQDPHYFDKITEADKKTWTSWMINRFLSQIPEYIELINEIQHLSKTLPDSEYYRLLIMIIPKRQVFGGYIKGKSSKYSKDVMEFLAKHYQCSVREIDDYLEILDESDVKTIYYSYGFDEKQVKNFLEKKTKKNE